MVVDLIITMIMTQPKNMGIGSGTPLASKANLGVPNNGCLKETTSFHDLILLVWKEWLGVQGLDLDQGTQILWV